MILDEYFERIVIISLPDCFHLAQRALSELKDKNLSNKAEVFRAIDGYSLTYPAWWNAGHGAWGCFKSHYEVVQKAIKDGVETLLILEDDCIWRDEAADMLKEFLSEVPNNWGQIYLGGQLTDIDVDPEKITKSVCRPKSVHRTHAYALSKKAMPVFLNYITNPQNFTDLKQQGQLQPHLDHVLQSAHNNKKWPIYCPSWWIAGQGKSFSKLTQKETPDQWWNHSKKNIHTHLPLIIVDDREPDEDLLKNLFFGISYHEKPDTPWLNVGIHETKPKSAANLLNAIALEAFWHQQLPAIYNFTEKVPDDVMEEIERQYAGPIFKTSDGIDLKNLSNYPLNKMVYHDWLASDETTENNYVNMIAKEFPLEEEILYADQEMENIPYVNSKNIVLRDGSLESRCNGAIEQIIMNLRVSRWENLLIPTTTGVNNSKRNYCQNKAKPLPYDVRACTVLVDKVIKTIPKFGGGEWLLFKR